MAGGLTPSLRDPLPRTPPYVSPHSVEAEFGGLKMGGRFPV